MTVRGRYNESMKNCLLSAAASGAFWLILLFVVSFSRRPHRTAGQNRLELSKTSRHPSRKVVCGETRLGARAPRPAREGDLRSARGGKASRTRLLYRGAQKTPSSGNLFPAERNQIQISNPRLCRQRQRRGITKLFLLPRLSVASVLYPSAHKPRYIFGRPQNARYFSSGAASSYFSRLPPSSHSRSR